MRTLFLLARHGAVAAVAAAALTTGCSDMPWSSASNPAAVSGAAADRQCQLFRSYSDRPYDNVLAECSRQLGEEACRRCLQ